MATGCCSLIKSRDAQVRMAARWTIVIGSSTRLEFQSFALPLKEIISRSSVWLTVLRSFKGLPILSLSSHVASSRFLDFHEPLRLLVFSALPSNDEYARQGSRSCGLRPLLAVNRTVPQPGKGKVEREREREEGKGVDEVHQRVPFII